MVEFIQRYGNNIALESETQSITYNALITKINSLTSPLQKIAGSKKEIGIFMNPGIDNIIYCLASIQAGLNTYVLHPKSSQVTLKKINNWHIPIIYDLKNKCIIETLGYINHSILCDKVSEETNIQNVGFIDFARVTFTTSGTTSDTRFVSLPFTSIMAKSDMLADILKISELDINLLISPLCFIQSFWTLIMHMFRGAKIHIANFSLQLISEMLETNKITTLITTPSIIRGFLKSGIHPHYLRLLGIGGDYIDELTLNNLKDNWSNVSYCNIYGCTETAAADVVLGPILFRDIDKKINSIGKQTKYSQVKIVNQNGFETKPYEQGQIKIKNPFTQLYYFRNDVRIKDDEGYFETKDIGYFDKDGYIYYCGRMSGRIIYNGQKISTYEIENLLYKLENIREVVVIGEPHEIYGEVPICYIVASETSTVFYEMLQIYLKENLESYKIPKKIIFVDALPKTNSDKIFRIIDRYKELS